MIKYIPFIFLILLLNLSCQPKKPSPAVEEALPALRFSISSKHMNKLKRKRLEAFQEGILVSKSEDFVPVHIDFKNKKIPAQVRLKGDWLDHLKGSKWSYRVRLDEGNSILGMEQFSLHHPRTRSYLDEWIFHKALEQEDLLTPAYTFVQVWWNKEYKGVYALEEHFCQTLLARQHRKDAPILKFAEDGFWQIQLHHKRRGKNLAPNLPDFEAAEIQPFQKKRILRDSVLLNTFLAGRQKLESFRSAQIPAAQLLDISRWAKFYALTDLFKAYHSLRWHNLRFYYDPVKGHLEPVIFDAFGQNGVYNWFSKSHLGFHNERYGKVYFAENYMIFHLFNDLEFRKQYIYYLKKFSQNEYLKSLKNQFQSQIETLEKVLQTETPDYQYKFEKLSESAESIRQFINDYDINHPSFNYTIYDPLYKECLMQAPMKDIALNAVPYFDGQRLILSNYFCQPIQIHATGPKKSKPINVLDRPLNLPAYNTHKQQPKLDTISFSKGDRYVFFSVPNIDYWYRKKITTLPSVDSIDFPSKESLKIDSTIFQLDGNNLRIPAGNFQLKKNVIIPSNIKLTIDAGANIDLVGGAACFIYGTVEMNGKKGLPIEITSSDKTGRGIHFIDNEGVIQFNHVKFSQLSGWMDKGMVLSGGVNIIETKAIIRNCSFSDSHSEDALNIVRSDTSTLENVSFRNCQSDALDIDFSNVFLSNGSFFQIGGDAVDLSGSKGEINQLEISETGDKGLSVGEGSNLFIKNINCRNSNIGIAVKDGSQVIGENYSFSNCDYGAAIFTKKAFYKTASLTINQVNYNNIILENYILENGHQFILNGKNKIQTHDRGEVASFLYE